MLLLGVLGIFHFYYVLILTLKKNLFIEHIAIKFSKVIYPTVPKNALLNFFLNIISKILQFILDFCDTTAIFDLIRE